VPCSQPGYNDDAPSSQSSVLDFKVPYNCEAERKSREDNVLMNTAEMSSLELQSEIQTHHFLRSLLENPRYVMPPNLLAAAQAVQHNALMHRQQAQLSMYGSSSVHLTAYGASAVMFDFMGDHCGSQDQTQDLAVTDDPMPGAGPPLLSEEDLTTAREYTDDEDDHAVLNTFTYMECHQCLESTFYCQCTRSFQHE
jgi:hypothetical protein